MSIMRIIAVGVIYIVASAGWWILGTATSFRSDTFFNNLGPRVEALWGTPIYQAAPTFSIRVPGSDKVRWMTPLRNDIRVRLEPEYRKKGLIWYPTYTCSFTGTYTLASAQPVAEKVRLHFDFPSPDSTYDSFSITLDDASIEVPVDPALGIDHIFELQPKSSRVIRVRYETRGLSEWRYLPDRSAGRVRHLDLIAETGFKKVDYPEGSLSPMTVQETETGMTLSWRATDLITGADIGIIVPEKLNPGPLTSRITFFAPVCLLFFFVLIGAINIIYRVDIHPMHYLFVASGFFAFHLLLVYLADHLYIHAAFLISAAVSVTLVTAYLSAALKGRLPWKIAVAGQLGFLVLFSYSFFLKGITGLTVALGSVVTLAVMMKVTAHIDWNEIFGKVKLQRRSVSKTGGAVEPSGS